MGTTISDNVQSDMSNRSLPSVKFIHITEGTKATGQAKFGGNIPDYLIKCRTTVNLIKAAEDQGALKPGMEIIEPAFGSSGVILACIAADRGYILTLTMPETLSYDRRKVLAELGANLHLTPADEGQKGAIKRAEEIASAEPQKYFLPLKFVCLNCMWDHMDIVEPELSDNSGGTIHISLSEVATVDTINGVSRFSRRIKGKIPVA